MNGTQTPAEPAGDRVVMPLGENHKDQIAEPAVTAWGTPADSSEPAGQPEPIVKPPGAGFVIVPREAVRMAIDWLGEPQTRTLKRTLLDCLARPAAEPAKEPPRAGKLPTSCSGFPACDEFVADLRSELAATAQVVSDAEAGIRLRNETIAHLRTAVAHRLGCGCLCESCCAVRMMGLDLERETAFVKREAEDPA